MSLRIFYSPRYRLSDSHLGSIKTLRTNSGFLIPLAAIIVLGLAVLALGLSKLTTQSASAAVNEALSVQTFYAAESGAHFGLNQIFFPNPERSIADANCASLSITMAFSASGLSNCQAVISCDLSFDSANTTSYYNITSAAQCGGGEFVTQRTVSVSAFSK